MAVGKKAEQRFLSMRPGDAVATAADVSDLAEAICFSMDARTETVIERFVA